MRLILFLFRFVYYLFYHQFAWTYDFISALVSLGRWQDWVSSALPYLDGRVLELGFGPGHLQVSLNENHFQAFGLDESPQMARLASRNLRRNRFIPRLSRGYAQNLPFATGTFDSVVATFPSDFIYDPRSLQEIWRVLAPGGILVILPMAWITGTLPLERLVAWLLRVVGEAPGKPGKLPAAIKDRFAHLRFNLRSELVPVRGNQVLVVLAKKLD